MSFIHLIRRMYRCSDTIYEIHATTYLNSKYITKIINKQIKEKSIIPSVSSSNVTDLVSTGLENVLNRSHTGFIWAVMDDTYNLYITQVNEAFTKLFGYNKNDVIGKPVNMLIYRKYDKERHTQYVENSTKPNSIVKIPPTYGRTIYAKDRYGICITLCMTVTNINNNEFVAQFTKFTPNMIVRLPEIKE